MIALLSDIHGNLPALRAVLDTLDQWGVSRILFLGDVAGYAPQVNECCDELRARSVLGIRGNHEHYLITGESSGRSQTADACIAHQRSIVTPDTLSWLTSLPLTLTHAGITIVHGGWNDPLDEYLCEVDSSTFAGQSGRMFASGHTHIPLLWSNGSLQYCNPGSVGQPRDGDARASFAVFDGERFTVHRVAYDTAAARTAIREAGLPEWVGSNLPLGLPIGAAAQSRRSAP